MEKDYLEKQYCSKKKSVAQIATEFGCSQNKITYWLQKHGIRRRSISEGVYVRSNPEGDPFCFKAPKTDFDWFLYGLGLGLFWGEGNKVNKNSVRLGNTDLDLIRYFLLFMDHAYQIKKEKLRFGLQIFNDIPKEKALRFWITELGISRKQFQKVIITNSIRKGTYKKRSDYGVLTVYFSNTKLRDMIMTAISELRQHNANVAQLVERVHGKSH